MGGSAYSHDDYASRASARASTGHTGRAAFTYSAAAAAAPVHDAKAHPTLDPKGVDRESRDSDAHPKTLPIGVILDTTGSMSDVPVIIQGALPKLMGGFLDHKASGKQYIADYYPAILIGSVDDYYAQSGVGYTDGAGCLQVGQFESGMEIDDNLTNLWLTENGGGSYEESYDLAMYFFARHTKTDHFEKRGRKGYLFIIGDEHLYPKVDHIAVKKVMGDSVQDIKIEDIVKEVQQKYHVFFIIPNMTQHYNDASLERYWVKLLGQQHVLKLEDPSKICEMIVAAVAISENHVGLEEMATDGLTPSVSSALTVLAENRISADAIPPIIAGATGITRL